MKFTEAPAERIVHLNHVESTTMSSHPFAICRAAVADRDRLREIYRDAVIATGPQHYSVVQVAAWVQSADDIDAWDTWLREGSTWVACESNVHDRAIGVALVRPQDHVHLLYVDPAFHRRDIARALLARVEREARDEGVAALTTDASLISHPVFLGAGYDVVRWEDSPYRGEVFRRARMRKHLR